MAELNQLELGADPRYKNIDYVAQQADLQLVRDVEEGETVIKAARHTYLPQEPKESPEAYDVRLRRSGWWDGYEKCKAALVGMVFRKPPVFAEQLAPQIKGILDNIDLQGNHAAVFIKEQFAQSFDGHSFILIDMARPLDPAVATLADEQGRRPYWCKRSKDQVWNWVKGTNAKGEIVPVQVTLYECVSERVGRFAEKEVEQWRVLSLESGRLVWEIWRVREDAAGKEEIYLEDGGIVPNIDFIPIVIVPTRLKGFWKSKPTLLGLLRLMILHYQGWSDLRNILHKCCVPLLCFFGREGEEGTAVVLGPNDGLDMPSEGRVEWVVPAGTGFDAARLEQKDVERLAGIMGLELLAPRSDVEVTATQSMIDDSSQISELGGMVNALDDAINQALWMTGRFFGLPDAGTVEGESKLFTANKDFQRLALDPALLTQLSSMVMQGQLSVKSLWYLMERAELTRPGFKPETELSEIGEQALNLPPKEPVLDPALAA